MTDEEMRDEIARLTGQIVMARAVISFIIQLLALIPGGDMLDVFREKISTFTLEPEGRVDDELRREGLDHFKKRLLQSLPSDNS